MMVNPSLGVLNPGHHGDEAEGEELRRLGRSVTGCIWEDCRLPDPFDVMSSVTDSDGLPESFKEGLVRMSRLILIPEVLLGQCTDRSKCFMGLMMELGRAWMSIDGKLYLWDFRTGRDLTTWTLPEAQQPIIDVRVVKPRNGVFVEAIGWLLAVVTPSQVRLLGVQSGANDDLVLHDAGLVFGTDGVTLLSLAGSPEGRLFAGGSDGHIYELEYGAEEGWFTRRCRKVNKTGSALAMLAPTFLRASSSATSPEAFVELVVDGGRGLVWGLRDNGNLELFRITNGWEHLESIQFSPEAVIRHDPSLLRNAVGEKVIGIHTISKEESSKIALLAVTNTGMRLYYSFDARLSLVRAAAPISSGLRSCHPGSNSGTTNLNLTYLANTMANVHASGGCAGGIYAAGGALNQEEDILVIRHQLLEQRAEASSEWRLEGRVWAIETTRESPGWWHELVHGHDSPSRQILCLTNAGIYVFEKERPVDTLARLLADEEALGLFFGRFLPPDQAIAQALILATCHGGNVAFAAAQAIARQPADARHMGVLRYFGRLVGAAWKKPVRDLTSLETDKALPAVRALHSFLERSLESAALTGLVGRTAELLAFLGICLDYQLPLPTDIDLELLASSPVRGPALVKALGAALVRQQLHLQASVDALCAVLRDRAPSFFSPADALLFEGSDALARAMRASDSPRQQRLLLDEALSCFLEAAPQAPLESLEEALEGFRRAAFFPGILALGQTRPALHDAVLAALDDLLTRPSDSESIFEAALSLETPKDLRMSICDWLFTRGIASAVLLAQPEASSEIITYLEQGAFQGELLVSRGKADVLCKYLAKHGEAERAGETLLALATATTRDASLDALSLALPDRIQYLSTAVATLKASASPSCGAAEETLEVALVQLDLLHALHSIDSDWTTELTLHSRLHPLTTLFLEFSEPLGLPAISLRILHTAGHADAVLVGRLWQRLLAPQQGDLQGTASRLQSAASQLYPSDTVAMPLGYLVDMLAVMAWQQQQASSWFRQAWTGTVVPWERVVGELRSLRAAGQSFWSAPDRRAFLDALICDKI